MGHPPGAVTLPAPAYSALADEVDPGTPSHGGSAADLAAAITGSAGGRPAQLAAIAWLFDPPHRHVLLVDHRVFGWSCPGGHVEAGEHPADAAARELAEETGVVRSPDDRSPISVSRAAVPADAAGPAHDHWLIGYRFTAPLDVPLTPERDPVAWHPVDTIPSPHPDDLVPLLTAILHRLW